MRDYSNSSPGPIPTAFREAIALSLDCSEADNVQVFCGSHASTCVKCMSKTNRSKVN